MFNQNCLAPSLSGLEVYLQTELNNSRVHRRAGDCTECGRRHIRAGIPKLRVVESVEELGTELEVTGLTQPPDRRSLDNRDVRVVLARAKSYADSAVAKARSYAVTSDHRPNGVTGRVARNAASVEVVIQPALHRADRLKIGVPTADGELSSITRDSKNVCCVRSSEGQRQT